MLDRESIQSCGFKNIFKEDKVVGFQIQVRSLYYRGVWLSQLRPATVIVDGESFTGDQITWTINDKTCEQSELGQYGDIHWSLSDPAVITVRKPGGLSQGFHDIEFQYAYSASYMPPNMDLLMAELHGPYKRRLIMV